jgi:hypothetical protein
MPALKGIFVADPCEFTARLGSESVTFVFDLAKMTLRRERDLKRSAAADNVDAMVKDLLDVLTSWDILDDAGQPVPLSADILLDLPAKALGNLIEGMSTAAQPSDAEGEASSVPSPELSTDSSEPVPTHQNGAATSQLPEHSASPSPT